VLPNSAVQLGGDCFEITNNTSQRGVVWNNSQMDLTQPFDITLSVWHDVHGADGIAFVLQTTGLGAHGAGGNALGYANSVPASSYPGISPSLAVELDLFQNNVAGVIDIAADHVSIQANGDLSIALAGPIAANPNGSLIPDNACFPLRVVWAPAPVNRMDVYWNGQLRLTLNQDIVATLFGGNPNVFWGITGSCGGVFMTQRVCVGADFAIAGPDRNTCVGDTLQLSASGGVNYQWGLGFPVISNPNIANPIFSSTIPQTFNIPLTATNLLGCTDNDTVRIVVADTPTVSLNAPPAICPGDTALIFATPSGGLPPYGFVWSTGTTSDTLSATPLTSTTFTVTVTESNNCSATASVPLLVHPQESLDILDNDTLLCAGQGLSNLSVTASSGINAYLWSPSQGVSNVTSPAPSIQPSQSTTYVLTGSNSTTGCSVSDSIRILVSNLQLSDLRDTTVCLGDTVLFDLLPVGGSGDYSVQWIQTGVDTLSYDTILNPIVVASGGGTYFAQVTDNVTGCVSTLNVTVTVRTLQVTATPSSVLINPGQRVQLEAFGASTYVWEPDTMLSCATCPSPVSMPGSSITYTVTGTDTSGCQGRATVVIVTDSLFLPNVFSPNGDGINDVLLLNYHGDAFYQILIFDRWGREIFQTKDKLVMWDGRTSGGENAPEGVYFMAVRIIGDDAIPQKDKQKVFHVTLLR
jgi:gliding motility-associated-like protein